MYFATVKSTNNKLKDNTTIVFGDQPQSDRALSILQYHAFGLWTNSAFGIPTAFRLV